MILTIEFYLHQKWSLKFKFKLYLKFHLSFLIVYLNLFIIELNRSLDTAMTYRLQVNLVCSVI